MKSVLILTCLSILLWGCSGSNTKETTLPDGSKANVTAQDDGVKIQGDQMDASLGSAATISEEDLHMKVYPNSKLLNDKSMKVKTPTEESALAFYSSSDQPEAIKKFFEDQLGGAKFQEVKTGGSVTMIVQKDNSDGSTTAISITQKEAAGPVEISIAYGKQSKK